MDDGSGDANGVRFGLLPTVANGEDGNGSKKCYRRTVTGQFLRLETHVWVAGQCERARIPVPDRAQIPLKKIIHSLSWLAGRSRRGPGGQRRTPVTEPILLRDKPSSTGSETGHK